MIVFFLFLLLLWMPLFTLVSLPLLLLFSDACKKKTCVVEHRLFFPSLPFFVFIWQDMYSKE